MPKGREYELKLSIAPNDTERLLSHPLLRASRPYSRFSRLVSTYFDTPDALLRRKRVSLRVRQSEAGTTQTLKRSGTSLVDRSEWEQHGGGTRPDPRWLRTTPLKALFKAEDVLVALDAQFAVETSRTVVPLTFAGGTIEGALDQGLIRAKNLSLPLNEFELELKGGAEHSVMALARALARDLPLVLSLTTKAERGYGVADLTWGTPVKRIALDLSATKTIGDLFTAAIQACLHAVCRNAALIGTADSDVEAVHKTRIAVRHLRAALRLFQPVLKRHGFKALNAELRWVSGKLGAARDADVFQQGTFDAVAKDVPGMDGVADAMRDARNASYKRLRKAFASFRWRLLLLDVLAFSTDGMRRRDRDERAAPFVRRRLGELHRTLARRTRRWSRLTDEDMHDVRKRAKMLRYGLDLIATLPKLNVERRILKRLGTHLQALQQTLGETHDRIALRQRIGDVILRRETPNGTTEANWETVREAARRLAASAPQDNAALAKAHRSVKRLRRLNV